MSNRIKTVLGDLINKDQTGFIKSKYIGENIRILKDLIEKVNSDDDEGIIYSLLISKKPLTVLTTHLLSIVCNILILEIH